LLKLGYSTNHMVVRAPGKEVLTHGMFVGTPRVLEAPGYWGTYLAVTCVTDCAGSGSSECCNRVFVARGEAHPHAHEGFAIGGEPLVMYRSDLRPTSVMG
jgi:hypothetical protein